MGSSMNKDDLLDKLEKLDSSNPDLANRIWDLWKEDNTRDYETLEKLAGVGFDALAKKETSKVRSPVTEAFGISEDQYRLLIDPNSKINWMKLPTKELLKAAIKGGYVKDLPKNAPEYKKKEQRDEFNTFLKMLANESNLQGRRNAIREYENTKLTEDPIGWAQKGINSLLFRTYAKRAKEQALKGKGATGFLDMDAGDVGALGGDIGVNALLGAGAGGISAGLLKGGLGYGGLRTFGNVAGSDIAAGVLGGLGSVANRDMNTDEGARGYEYFTEPALTGALNVIATPATLRTGVSTAANMFGLGGAKLDGLGQRSAMQSVQRLADRKYAEPALASKLRELDENAARTVQNSPVSEKTAAKINEMFDVLNDGATPSPDGSRIFDDLQALYEGSVSKTTGVRGDANIGMELLGAKTTPSEGRFRIALDNKIDDLEGALKVSAGASEAPALTRELKYYKNFRDMMDNGLIDAKSYLNETNPGQLIAPKSEYVLTKGTENVPFFELGKKASKNDIDFIKDYVDNVNAGNNLVYDNGLATRVRELSEKYPEFGRYVQSQRLIPGPDMSLWKSRGTVFKSGEQEMPWAEENVFNGTGMRAWGSPKHPTIKVTDEQTGKVYTIGGTPKLKAKDILLYGGQDVAMDVAKPAIVEARLTKYDKPDNSYDALYSKYEALRANKPEAVDAAMSFKYDPWLESSKQLTMEERDLLDRFRKAQLLKDFGE